MRSVARHPIRHAVLFSCVAAGCAGSQVPPERPKISRESIGGDVKVSPGLNIESLGAVAVASFEIVGDVRLTVDGKTSVVHKTHEDTMGATDSFVRELLPSGIELVARGRQEVDARLKELEYGVSGMIDAESAPYLGKELGAKTLIVGRYQFNAEAEGTQGENVYLRPQKVFSQTIRIKGFDVDTGKCLFDVELTLDGKTSGNLLLAKSLSKFAAKRLLEELQ